MSDAAGATEQTWEALLLAVAETGDRDAFSRLFVHFAPRVKSYLLRQGSSPSQAEDIAQETLALLWRKAGLFDPAKASASTWIFRIARNQMIDRIRRRQRPELDPNDPLLVPAAEPAPDHQASKQQDIAAVRSALAELPEKQREVIMLSFFEEDPHPAIAEKLQLPIGTVKSRIRLALARLDTLLDRNAHGES
ncbi:MAG: sigma-70 family RNA polymerase sigma factor [Alphaproteobacteria bacterium]|nr:sigma-70 family RNA polymerase sigma factor [Alphaproteobacteria bacterium]